MISVNVVRTNLAEADGVNLEGYMGTRTLRNTRGREHLATWSNQALDTAVLLLIAIIEVYLTNR